MTNFNPSNIVKLSLHQIEPQGLTFGAQTNSLPFESFSDSLHLSSPNLKFEQTCINFWYNGIPIHFLLQITNLRYQMVSDINIKIIVLEGSLETFKKSLQISQSLEPQKFINFPFDFIPKKKGSITIVSGISFIFNSEKYESNLKLNYEIKSPFKIILKTFKSTNYFLEVNLSNNFYIPLNNIRLQLKDSSKIFISSFLEKENIISQYLSIEPYHKELFIYFDLPFYQNCEIIETFQPQPINPSYPIKIEFLNLINIINSFSPYELTLSIFNREKRNLIGKCFLLSNESIFPINSHLIEIPEIKSEEFIEIKIPFIALKQGNFLLPPIQFNFQDLPSFKIENSIGFLVVGNK